LRRAPAPEVVFPASRGHNQAPKEHPWRQSYKQMRTPAAAFSNNYNGDFSIEENPGTFLLWYDA
jgi:hypothetical protein